jgi:integrase/recombinase XerD
VDQAPQVVLHWPPLKGVTDKQTQDITLFKQNSVEEWSRKGWSPMAALKRTEISSAIAARGIQYVGEDLKEVGDQLKERLDALHESVDLLSKKLLEKKKGRKKRLELPLRDRASGSVLDYLLKLKRPENFSYYCWSRNRVAIVLLRWLGARASDVKKLTLKEINQLKKDGTLQLSQVKTGKIRVIVIPKRAQEDLEKVKIDVERVFGEDNEKMLATPAHSYQEISNTQWLNSLNQFIKLATPNFNLILSSHSFRVNYVTSLLRSVPLEKVSKIVGHSDIRTTVRYDRYVIDKDQVKGVLEELG